MLERDLGSTTPRPKRSIPAWMRDRATLEQIRRARLRELSITEPLSPGTKRLARVLDQVFDELEQRRAEEAERNGPPPF